MAADFDVVNAAVWPGHGEQVLPSTTIRVRNGRIDEVAASAPATPGIDVVDAAGLTVIPGLTDAHVHLTTASDHRRAVDNASYRALTTNPTKMLHGIRNAVRALSAGFTSLRVMGHRGVGEVEYRDFVNEGLLVGPRMQVAPWVVSMTGGRGDLFWPATLERSPLDTADGVDEVRKIVRLQRKQGADFIKVTASGGMLSGGDQPHWPNYTQDELTALADEAHTYDLRVASHAHSASGAKRSILAGIDTIEHGSFIDDECIDLMLEHGTFLVPTMAIGEWVRSQRASGGASAEGVAKLERVEAERMANFRAAFEAGVPIAMGTDSTGTICPFGQHALELELYVAAGLTAAQALETSTVNAPAAMGIGDRVGRIAPGYAADLLLLEQSPLEDIGVVRRPGGLRAVYKDGVDVTAPWPLVEAEMAVAPSIFS